MIYDFYTVSLLSIYETYLPYMSEEDISDILRYGAVPGPWKIKEWEKIRRGEISRTESAIKTALAAQK